LGGRFRARPPSARSSSCCLSRSSSWVDSVVRAGAGGAVAVAAVAWTCCGRCRWRSLTDAVAAGVVAGLAAAALAVAADLVDSAAVGDSVAAARAGAG